MDEPEQQGHVSATDQTLYSLDMMQYINLVSGQTPTMSSQRVSLRQCSQAFRVIGTAGRLPGPGRVCTTYHSICCDQEVIEVNIGGQNHL